MRCGSLFSGVGLLDYGLTLAGFEHAWLCEKDEWRRSILAQRFPGATVHDDVRGAGAAWGRVDLVAGGCPCKGASSAGKREGFGHPETVLWREMARAVRELRPRYVLIENVAAILSLHDGAVWGEVLGDLAALGFDLVWDCIPAGAVGAPHLRDRVFAIASHPEAAGLEGGGGPVAPDASRVPEGGAGTQAGADGERARQGDHAAADPDGNLPRADHVSVGAGEDGQAGAESSASARGVAVDWGEYEHAIRRWEAVHGPAPEPLVRRVDDRGAARVERSRLSALGDGVQVQVGYIAGLHIQRLERERLMTEIAACGSRDA